MSVTMEPIGFVQTAAQRVPRHWSVSDVEGVLIIDEKYLQGLKDVKAGQRMVVIFHFHRSQPFTSSFLTQTPPHRGQNLGVFSICSPIRPNPIGMSILEVVAIEGNRISVKGLDMQDGTPILDLKPHIQDEYSCPSFQGQRRPATP